MDPDSSSTEIDSFALKFQKSVAAYKENFEKVTQDDVLADSISKSLLHPEKVIECDKLLQNIDTCLNDDTIHKRIGLNDRLRELVMKFNEQIKDEQLMKKTRKVNAIHPKKIITSEYLKVFPLTPKPNINNLKMKKSIAELRKSFEDNGETKMKAPESMSVREKARFFELKRLEEEAAREQQYYPVHSQSKFETKTILPSEKHTLDETYQLLNYEKDLEDTQLVQTLQQGKTVSYEKVDDWVEFLKIEDDKIDANLSKNYVHDNENEKLDQQSAFESVDDVLKAINNMDEKLVNDELAFTTLDIIETAPKQFLVSLSGGSSLTSIQEDVLKFPSNSTPSNLSLSASDEFILLASESSASSHNQFDNKENREKSLESLKFKTLNNYREQQKIQKPRQSFLNDQHKSESRVLYKSRDSSKNQLNCNSFAEVCVNKINKLYHEMSDFKQMHAQAGKALCLCLSSSDKIHSQARVEAERVLLISDYYQYLTTGEICRLRVMAKEPNKYYKSNSAKAMLSFFKIQVPLKRDFVVQLSKMKTQSEHHFLCFISHASKMECSQAVNASETLGRGYLEFFFDFTTRELEADFKVTIKLFQLELFKNEKLKNFAKSLRWKPSNLSRSPADVSPAKLDNMSTNFKEVAELVLELKNVCQLPKFFTFPNLSPLLKGILTMDMKLKVTYEYYFEGYFDYQDFESKFWKACWFVINGFWLSYWRFQDDFIHKKAPIGEINLKHCINPVVEFLKPEFRNLSTRLNTIVLVTMQPEKVSNATKLVTGGVIKKPKTQSYFISSSSREEMTEFSNCLNEVLESLRTWEMMGRIVPKYSLEEFNHLLSAF